MNEVNEAVKKGWDKKKIGWIVTVVVPIILLLIPCTESYTLILKEFFAIVSFIMLIFAFELMNNLTASLMLFMLFMIFKMGTDAEIFSSWSNNIPWSLVGALLLVGCMNETQILKRFSYWLMIKAGGKVTSIIFGFMFVGILLSTILAANIGIPLGIVAFGLCSALDIKPKSNTAALIMMVAYSAMAVGATVFLGPLTSLGVGVIQKIYEDFTIGYAEYFIHNAPFIIYGFIITFILFKVFKQKNELASKEVLIKEYKALNKMDIREKKLIGLFAILFVCMLLSSKIGISIGWMILIAGVVCFLPFVKLGTEKAIGEIRWGLVVFMTACLSIGTIANNAGAGEFISNALLPLISGLGKIPALMLIWVLGVVINFVMTPLAAQASMLIPLAQIGTGLGISPNIILYVFQNSLNQALLPYEIALLMFFYSFGLMNMKQCIKAGLAVMIANFIWVFAVMLPYWHLIGIF